MILQRPRNIVGDAEFEPRTSASEVWRATNVATTSPRALIYILIQGSFLENTNVLSIGEFLSGLLHVVQDIIEMAAHKHHHHPHLLL